MTRVPMDSDCGDSKFLHFAAPDIGDEEVEAVTDCLRSGWITTGPRAKQFEEKFSEFFGGGLQAIAVSSATAGLHLGLEALGVGPGDEVITTTHTFTATAEVIRYLGADPVFVDIDRETLCIDWVQAERAISPRTKVIMPVHFGGRAANMVDLTRMARQNGVFILEDAAHAFPATSGGKLVGGLESSATVFSFYANKTITTGEGGMVVTRSEELAQRARTMRLHGISRDAFERFTSKSPSWYYEVIAPGFKYNLPDVAAAIGLSQLGKAWTFQKRREFIAQRYYEGLAALPIKLPPKAEIGEIHAWHLYVIQLTKECHIPRDEFMNRLFEAGVGCSVHYIPLHLHPYWRDSYRLCPEMFPVSQSVYEASISLPIYSRMSDSDVDKVIRAIWKIVKE